MSELRTLLGLAFRNLLRAKRRNLLSGGTMVLGAAALVLGNGLADGIERQLTRNLVAVQSGHLQVVARDLDFEPQNSPFDVYGSGRVPEAQALAERLERDGREAGVLRAVPFLFGRGTAMAGNRSSLASLIGVVPEREPELAAAHAAEQGRFLPPGDELAVYVAAPVARKLRLGVGDSVSFVIQTASGAVNSLDLVVCGVFKKDAPWYDNAFYLPLAAAQSLFDMPGAATNIKLTLRDGSLQGARRARPLVEALVGRPADLQPKTRVHVESYDQAGRFYFAIIQADSAALLVLSSFLFAAAAVGIVNAMLMSVHERTREIGTLRALGLRRGVIARLFVCEGLALGSLAAAVGVGLGGALVLHWGARGIPLDNISLTWMAGGDVLYPVLRPERVLLAAGSICALSTLAALYPALSASRLEPREALQHA